MGGCFTDVTGGVCHLYRWSPLSVPVSLRTRLAKGAEGALKLGGRFLGKLEKPLANWVVLAQLNL